jgi:hypothetical protein
VTVGVVGRPSSLEGAVSTAAGAGTSEVTGVEVSEAAGLGTSEVAGAETSEVEADSETESETCEGGEMMFEIR